MAVFSAQINLNLDNEFFKAGTKAQVRSYLLDVIADNLVIEQEDEAGLVSDTEVFNLDTSAHEYINPRVMKGEADVDGRTECADCSRIGQYRCARCKEVICETHSLYNDATDQRLCNAC